MFVVENEGKFYNYKSIYRKIKIMKEIRLNW